MTKDLQLKPYNVQPVHKIKPSNIFKEVPFTCNLKHLVPENENFIDELIMSDRAHFFKMICKQAKL